VGLWQDNFDQHLDPRKKPPNGPDLDVVDTMCQQVHNAYHFHPERKRKVSICQRTAAPRLFFNADTQNLPKIPSETSHAIDHPHQTKKLGPRLKGLGPSSLHAERLAAD